MSSRALHSTLSANEEYSQYDAEEFWNQALENYRQETGRNLLEESFAKDLLSKSSVDEITERLKKFRGFRDHGRKILLLNVLAIVTKYCDRAAERHSWLRHAKDTVSLRTRRTWQKRLEGMKSWRRRNCK
ncbi:hypothetical protein PENSPDRAFT_663774 [Peniophora sp. CONT]|nr:hypothetical protein PENSPDRAFT_663774 [Peniophora sp. CONT]